MDDDRLARKMLKWSKLRKKLNALEEQIACEVLEREQTQIVGSCIAGYNKGRTEYDYESPIREFLSCMDESANERCIEINNAIRAATSISRVVDWRSVCKRCGIEPKIKKEPEKRVSIKLREKKRRPYRRQLW